MQLGKLAQDHASSQAVKDFGQRMVDDQRQGRDELKSLAQQKNVTLPADLDAKDTGRPSIACQSSNGAAFDRAYMRDMVADHKKDIAEIQKESNSGMDADVKSLGIENPADPAAAPAAGEIN